LCSGDGGTRTPGEIPEETALSAESGAKSGALITESDPDLARVLDAWPKLPPHIKAAVLALIGTAGLQNGPPCP
jgi:hypothetical protein